jgi:2-methylcitrate dehydratase PrpD
MELEKKLTDYVFSLKFDDIPPKPVRLMKDVLLNVLGGTIAGAHAPGCPQAVEQAREWGGNEEATILVHGGKVSAGNAAFANGFMARALALDEAMVGGLHAGGSAIPAGLAAAESIGGCTGKEFIASLVAGFELASRMHLASKYNGFDATGACVVFASTVVAARLFELTKEQLWNALGHALNMAGGSWQGTIDGSIAARVLQGTAAQGGLVNAQLARRGITGPINFLQGTFGYFHLFSADQYNAEAVGEDLGTRFELSKIFLKKYPTCGTTNASIFAILSLMNEKGVTAENLEEIKVRVTPFTYDLTGKPFQYGDNPRVSAMYSIQYCIANALVRGTCKLRDFDEESVRKPELIAIIDKVRVYAEPAWDETRQLASEVVVTMKDGTIYRKHVESPPGTAGNPLTKEDLLDKFADCVDYGGKGLSRANIDLLVTMIDGLEDIGDVRSLIPLLIAP